MSKVETKLSKMIFWVSPSQISYCTPSSKYTDLNQYERDRDHPHAFYDYGYFFEKERRGIILDGNWDVPQLKFTSLLEYQALYKHIKGIERWSLSKFADRMIKYMLMTNKESFGARYRFEGFNSPDEFIADRERQINSLIISIKENGVLPVGGVDCKVSKLDDISLNASRTGELLFNNRGHHRLALAKILDIKLIPTQIVVWHKNNFL
jgi:hypothetical protein